MFCFKVSIILLCVSGVSVWAKPPLEADLRHKPRQLFSLAMDALDKGQQGNFSKLQNQLSEYPLFRYLRFTYLQKTAAKRKNSEFKKFIIRYQDSHLSSQMRTQWLRELARREFWLTFIKEYSGKQSEALQCQYAYALFLLDRQQEAEKIAKRLWLVGRSRADECDKTFEQYKRSGLLDQQTIWKRAALAIENQQMDLAKYMLTLLENEQDRLWLQRWINTHWQPEIMLREPAFLLDRDIVRQIVLHGIKRIGQQDIDKAWSVWQASKRIYQFDPARAARLEQYLALNASYLRHPNALQWFADLNLLDEEAKQWRIRLALRAKQWSQAFGWLVKLSASVRKKEKWRYWRARCLQEMGKQDSDQVQIELAEFAFAELAKNRSYYGFLAADKIGREYALKMQSASYPERDLIRIAKHAGIIRARELFLLGMYPHARSEWRYATKKFTQKDLELAAGLASRWGWYDRVIVTFAKSRAPRNAAVNLPYPIAYRPTVLKNARRHNIDPAWVYGVLRQESAFMSDARSSAGAMGLMQLMQSTARYVAKKTKIPLKQSQELLEPEKNIQLGSAYLSMLLQKHAGNEVLATASYNAGGRRTFKWLPSKAMAADVWIESIPFTETRNYVGKVLGYTVIFDHLLHGRAIRLETRMPTISPIAKP